MESKVVLADRDGFRGIWGGELRAFPRECCQLFLAFVVNWKASTAT